MFTVLGERQIFTKCVILGVYMPPPPPYTHPSVISLESPAPTHQDYACSKVAKWLILGQTRSL